MEIDGSVELFNIYKIGEPKVASVKTGIFENRKTLNEFWYVFLPCTIWYYGLI